jgi:hypothetical protein
MNRKTVFKVLLFTTTLLVLSLAPLESHSLEFAYFAVYQAFAALVGIVLISIVALWNFRYQSNAVNRANLCLIAALPVGLGLLFALIHPNVHGVSLPVFFFYVLVLELSALILLISLAVRALRSRAKA